MKPKILLRVAAVLMLLHTIGHSMGALTWTKAPNNRVAAIISGMQTEHFMFMGKSISLGGFFSGYGICLILVLAFVSVLLWLLSINPVKSISIALGIFLIAFGVGEYIYFFPMPAIFSAVAGCCTLFSVRSNKVKA